jgi:Dipeptide/tripeptide permease
MGINAGAFIAPILTGILADQIFGTPEMPAYKVVFMAAGIGMVLSLIWFWFGRAQLKGVGAPPAGHEGMGRVLMVAIGALFFVIAKRATRKNLE